MAIGSSGTSGAKPRIQAPTSALAASALTAAATSSIDRTAGKPTSSASGGRVAPNAPTCPCESLLPEGASVPQVDHLGGGAISLPMSAARPTGHDPSGSHDGFDDWKRRDGGHHPSIRDDEFGRLLIDLRGQS
jgi:hypothetical protein